MVDAVAALRDAWNGHFGQLSQYPGCSATERMWLGAAQNSGIGLLPLLSTSKNLEGILCSTPNSLDQSGALHAALSPCQVFCQDIAIVVVSIQCSTRLMILLPCALYICCGNILLFLGV